MELMNPNPAEPKPLGPQSHCGRAVGAADTSAAPARFSVSFRKSDGATVLLTHLREDTAATIAADIRSAFPWVQVVVTGAR